MLTSITRSQCCHFIIVTLGKVELVQEGRVNPKQTRPPDGQEKTLNQILDFGNFDILEIFVKPLGKSMIEPDSCRTDENSEVGIWWTEKGLVNETRH